jgi:hypothetical protein
LWTVGHFGQLGILDRWAFWTVGHFGPSRWAHGVSWTRGVSTLLGTWAL